MVNIKINQDYISMTGHAGAHKNGTDLICAGISALEETFIISVQEMTNDVINTTLSSGKAIVSFPEGMSNKTKTLFESLIIGLKAMEASYPKNLVIQDYRFTKSQC